jgi:hypothetical protein
MSLATTIAALQAFNLAVPGVNTASTSLQASVNAADLPMIIVAPGPATFSEQAMGLPRRDCQYELLVLIAPIALGRSADDGYQASLVLMEALDQAYMAAQSTTLDGAVEHVSSWRRDKLYVLTFAGVDYHGTTYYIDVVEK